MSTRTGRVRVMGRLPRLKYLNLTTASRVLANMCASPCSNLRRRRESGKAIASKSLQDYRCNVPKHGIRNV